MIRDLRHLYRMMLRDLEMTAISQQFTRHFEVMRTHLRMDAKLETRQPTLH